MSSLRIALMTSVSALFLLLIGWGSRAGYQSTTDDHALLRLSWRMQGKRIENCRDRTPAELDALPVHMRTPRICESKPVAYRLILSIDDGPTDTILIRPAGARQDRPMYVLLDSTLAVGRREVEIKVTRADDDDEVLEFESHIDFRAGFIELITLDESGQLVHHSGHS